MKRIAFLTVLLMLVVAQYSFALGVPDFSGTWVLDPARSNVATGAQVTIVMRQTKATLSIDRKAGNRVETAVLNLDGTQSVNKLPSGKEKKSTSAWVGSTLVTKSTTDMERMTVQSTEVFSLSPDGKVLTIEATIHAPNKETKRTLFYNKQ